VGRAALSVSNQVLEKSMAKSSVKKGVFDDPPRKQVLLLSCMDLRFLDNTVAFMNRLNLQNRYDHIVFAGAAMGTDQLTSTSSTSGAELPWSDVFFDHLKTALNVLHEHLDCGAYKYLHPDLNIQAKYRNESDPSKLRKFHRDEAHRFAKRIDRFCKDQHKVISASGDDAWKDIRVRCLLMDLVGEVTDL
jgi:hypothetical protein